MPKRIPTPPPADDEPRYLAIYKPYPLNAHWELQQDCLDFARWFACCVGKEDLPEFTAFYYKPKARGLILVEIQRSYHHFDQLLGEHRWVEFLKNPSNEEKGKVSQVFYSTYNSDRAAQKEGWKRKSVEDAWFKNWSPKNPVVSFPYPSPHWCPVPPEDKTNKPVCRPLPVAVHAPPARPPPPVVGSMNWVATQSAPSPTSPTALRSAWVTRARSSPTVTIPTRTPNPSAKTATPASTTSHTNAKNKNTSISAQKATSPVSASSSVPWGSPPSATSTASSLPTPPAGPASINGKNATKKTTIDTFSEDTPLQGLSGAMADLSIDLHSDPHLLAQSESVDPDLAYVARWEKDQSFTDGDGATSLWADTEVEVTENLWGEEEEKQPTEGAVKCRAHGVICKRGICREYDKQLREARKKEKEASRSNKAKDMAKDKGKQIHNSGKANKTDNWSQDGFSAVRSHRKVGKRRPSQPAPVSDSGSDRSNHIGRMRAYSTSSNTESTADTATVDPW